MRTRAVAALLLILTAGRAAGAGVHLELKDRSAAQRCVASGGAIVATADGSRTPDVRVALRQGLSSYDVDLAADRVWSIAARVEGCWSAARDWSPALGNSVTIDLFAAGEVNGSFTGAAGDRPPRITGGLQAEAADAGAVEPLECLLAYPAWRCAVPADLPFDLRVEPAGFSPVHYWNVVVRPGQQTELEPQRLIAGASVNGWVQDAKGHPLRDATVSLAPLDVTHAALRRAETKSNARGFFQLAGITPGEYRLVARAGSLSPAVVPVVTMRPNEALTMSRVLSLLPLATLDVAVDPPLAPDDKPWTLAAYERVPLVAGATEPSIRRAASAEGRWTAKNLRADVYRLVVEDSSGSLFEERDVDLSNGSGTTLPLSIHALQVSGRLIVGDEPLQAELRFTNGAGKRLWVSTDGDGSFRAPFPAPGDWSPLVYPAGRNGPRIRAKSVHIDPGDRAPVVAIHLAGGRVKGTVVTNSGKAAKAAVHVTSDGILVAQQLTGDEGNFDFLGLDLTTYSVSAEAMEGTTKTPVAVDLHDNPSAELKLTVDPLRAIRGVVLTPAGQPASGALVRLSLDGGLGWSDLNADVEGRFDYAVAGETAEVLLVALTHSYPAAFTRLRLAAGTTDPFTIVLGAQGGRLHVRGKAYVIARDAVAPFFVFGLPYEGPELGAYVEPGSYSVCPQAGLSDDCRRILVGAGSNVNVDMLSPKSKEAR